MAKQETADIVIVGGGVIGSSIAYWLGAGPDFDGRVVVVERAVSVQQVELALQPQLEEPVALERNLISLE